MSVRGIRQAGNLRAGETAPLPGSSCAVAWSACQQLSTLASPVCSAGSSWHVANPLHVLLGNAPTLAVPVHPGEDACSSCVFQEEARLQGDLSF